MGEKRKDKGTRINHRATLWIAVAAFCLILLSGRIEPAHAETYYQRLAGNTRYETSFAIAEFLFKEYGKFDNMTVASGANYPDALSGCYLTYVKETPLLLVDANVETQVLQRIKKYTKAGGTVYLIGGPGSVSKRFEQRVKQAGYKTIRLAGKDRFETNLQILNTTGTKERELLVASGLNYPDSLSASAIPKPLLLVGASLTSSQKAFLRKAGIQRIYILGGEGSVNKNLERELGFYCSRMERIGGKDRYETSFLIAKYFFDDPNCIAFAAGTNYPDGLSGGPLAMAAEAPLVLTSDNQMLYPMRSALDFRPEYTFFFGGTGSVSKEAAEMLLYRDLISREWLKKGYKKQWLSGSIDKIQVDIYFAHRFFSDSLDDYEVWKFTNPTDEDLMLTLERVTYKGDFRVDTGPTVQKPIYIPAGGSAIAIYDSNPDEYAPGYSYSATSGTVKKADASIKKKKNKVLVQEGIQDDHRYLAVVDKDTEESLPYACYETYADENGYIFAFERGGHWGQWLDGPGEPYASRETYVIIE